MKHFLTTYRLFLCMTVIGQTTMVNGQKVNPYNKETELRLVKEVENFNLVTDYQIDAGFEGQTLKINADGTFAETSYSCDGRVPMDNGKWTFQNGMLTLNAGKNVCSYELVIFQELLFLVNISQREKFIKEFRRAFKSVNDDKERGNQIGFSASVLREMNILYYHKWLK